MHMPDHHVSVHGRHAFYEREKHVGRVTKSGEFLWKSWHVFVEGTPRDPRSRTGPPWERGVIKTVEETFPSGSWFPSSGYTLCVPSFPPVLSTSHIWDLSSICGL